MMIVWIMLRILRSRSMIDLGHGCIIVYNVKIVIHVVIARNRS